MLYRKIAHSYLQYRLARFFNLKNLDIWIERLVKKLCHFIRHSFQSPFAFLISFFSCSYHDVLSHHDVLFQDGALFLYGAPSHWHALALRDVLYGGGAPGGHDVPGVCVALFLNLLCS